MKLKQENRVIFVHLQISTDYILMVMFYTILNSVASLAFVLSQSVYFFALYLVVM